MGHQEKETKNKIADLISKLSGYRVQGENIVEAKGIDSKSESKTFTVKVANKLFVAVVDKCIEIECFKRDKYSLE